MTTYAEYYGATFPTADEVLDSADAFGPTGADITPAYHAPEPAEVLEGAAYGPNSGTVGTYHAPDPTEVINTAVYGVGSATAGTVVQADTEDVRSGTTYGPDSSLTGTLVVTGGGGGLSGELAGVSPLVGATSYPAPVTVPQVHERHATDTRTKMFCSLATVNEAGEVVAIDLTGVQVRFKMWNVGTGQVALAETLVGVTVENASAGLVSYDFSSGAVSEAGRYRGFFVITVSGETDHYPAKTDDLIILIDDQQYSAQRAFSRALLQS